MPLDALGLAANAFTVDALLEHQVSDAMRQTPADTLPERCCCSAGPARRRAGANEGRYPDGTQPTPGSSRGDGRARPGAGAGPADTLTSRTAQAQWGVSSLLVVTLMHTVLSDDQLLADLNAAQREAVLHTRGPLLVLAGAGSGKTKVLTTRLARLISTQGVDPSRILAVTFTNKAAGEMKARIGRILGLGEQGTRGMWVGTFHSIGARLLRLHAQQVGRSPSFTIYDQDDVEGLTKRLMATHRISPKEYTPRAIHGCISDAKNALVGPDEYMALAKSPMTQAAALVYQDYGPALLAANAVDFDDLLMLPVELLRRDRGVLDRWRHRFQYLLVDEYQDTNGAQYALVKLLASTHRNLCVVGDEDQSIYRFRGADIRNILDFNKDFTDARVVRLEDNYRSTPAILHLANTAIAANTSRLGKTLRATRPAGEPVASVHCDTDRDEAAFVLSEVRERQRRDPSLALNQVAILYRTNAQSRVLEEALRLAGVPYRLIGAVRFYDRKEIRDVMSYLKLMANPADDEAFRRAIAVPKRGCGDTAIDALARYAQCERLSLFAAAQRAEFIPGLRPAARSSLAAFTELLEGFQRRAATEAVDVLLADIVKAIKYEDYLAGEGEDKAAERGENVRELISGAAQLAADGALLTESEDGMPLTPLEAFLQQTALVSGTDGLDPSADAVTLMTVHNAKGLEFPVVFVTGLEEHLFPLAKAVATEHEDPAELEEERRLFYVAVTRAERALYLTHAASRARYGSVTQSEPSRFLLDLPGGAVAPRSTAAGRHSVCECRADGASPQRAHAIVGPGSERPAFAL